MDNFITVADFHSGIQIYVAITIGAFVIISFLVLYLQIKLDKKTITNEVEKAVKTEMKKILKHLVGMEANSDKVFAMNARTAKAFDWAFLREIKAANSYSKINAIEPANGSLFLATGDLEKTDNLSRLMTDVREIADVFASIEEMKMKSAVDQKILLKIENDFKIKYENSIKK